MLIQADARSIPLKDGCVQCVVTSPPYWGLRDYGVSEQIGLEPDLESYVGAIVTVFRELRRVLSDDGTAWVNLGDGYDAGTRATRCASAKAGKHGYWSNPLINFRTSTGMGPKQMLGIPWRVALALQADGWILRSDVVWHKPNPMPESVTDRPTKSHEYVFLLSKRERYYYDAEAIREPASLAMEDEIAMGYAGRATKDYDGAGVQDPSAVKARIIAGARRRRAAHARGNGVNPKAGKNEESGNSRLDGFNQRWAVKQNASFSAAVSGLVDFRNKRTVWTIPTMAYAGAHFATMPEALVEPCILAGSRLGDLVFDPFSGSGTVLAVAERLGRRNVGTDLNPTYHELAKKRTRQRGLRW